MILKRLTLRNFRQYRGEHSIHFADDAGPSGANVTVVFGENGRGKTGLYRAMLYALFAEDRLAQDDDVSPRDIRLVNASAVQESQEKEVVTASVELEFKHRDTLYTLRRSRNAIRQGVRVEEEAGSVVMHVTQADGNTLPIEDAVKVGELVEEILNRRVKDYYLFDGERMDRLTRAGPTQSREVAKGIRSLLDIDALENARSAMTRVSERFAVDLGKASSVDYARVLKEIETCEQESSHMRQRVDQIDDELGRAEEEISGLDKELEAYKEIKHLVVRRQDLQVRIDLRERDRQAIALTLCNSVPKASMLLLRSVATKVFNNIESRRQNGELPAEIRRDLIDRVLRDDLCICGRTVSDDIDSLASIEAWRQKTSEEAVEDSALRLWQQLGGVIRHLSDYEHEITGQLQLYGGTLNDAAEYERELHEIAEKIGHTERGDASGLETHRSRCDEKRVALLAERKNLETSLAAHKSQLEQLNAKKLEEAAKVAKKDEYTARVELAREVANALQNVYESFTREIRDRLAILATEALKNILDEAGQANICRVKVKDDYSLEVFNRFGEPWLAEISAGQRQVLSIAFIAALAEAASNGSLLEMPLFMDTPFGRLSGTHRDNLMRVVPTKAAQWVLLATDTEFRDAEAKTLEQTKRWGRLYFLNQGPDGNTVVEERSPTSNAFRDYLRSGGAQ